MRDAKTLLFVHDDQPQIRKGNILTDDAVRPDYDINLTLFELIYNLLLLQGRTKTR